MKTDVPILRLALNFYLALFFAKSTYMINIKKIYITKYHM